MDLSVTFLGTAGAAPSPLRAPMSLLIQHDGEKILFDCGEGTQRQLLRAGGIPQIEHVFITHFHADHTLGLIGLLKTFALWNRTQPLHVHGPAGMDAVMKDMRRLYGRLTYKVLVHEHAAGDSCDFKDFKVVAFAVEHGCVALGYALVEDDRPGHMDVAKADSLGVAPQQRKLLQRGESVLTDAGNTVNPGDVLGASRRGRKVVYTGDTRPCRSVVDAARGADLLIHEAAFGDDDAKRAAKTKHSTVRGAARVAREAGVKQLALVHTNSRCYVPDVKREAKKEFRHVIIPSDLDALEVPRVP